MAQRRAYHYLADWILEYWTWKTSVNSSSAYLGTKTKDLTSPNLPQSRRSSSWRPNEGTPHTKRCWDSLFTVYTCRGHYLELVCQGTYSAESKCTFPIIIAYVSIGNLHINKQKNILHICPSCLKIPQNFIKSGTKSCYWYSYSNSFSFAGHTELLLSNHNITVTFEHTCQSSLLLVQLNTPPD
jgi:hypothetical protein